VPLTSKNSKPNEIMEKTIAKKKKIKPKDLYNLKGDAIVNASYNVLSQMSLEIKNH
jgi:hypothetical protein